MLTHHVIENAPPSPPARIDAVDALRGFALLGIIVAHMCEQFLGAPPPPSQPNFGVYGPLDQVAQMLYGVLVTGKFFPIFSLLFGVSFFIQMDRAAARGESFERRFLWRLAILFAIGLVHHAIYRGDILTIFALLGVPLVACYRASNRTLLVVVLLLGTGLPRLVVSWLGWLAGSPAMQLPGEEFLEVYFATLQNGSPWDVARLNLLEGFATKYDFQFNVFGRGYQTMALFVLGLWLARAGWHETLADRRPQLRRVLLACLAVFLLVAAGLAALLAIGGAPTSPDDVTRLQVVLGLTLLDTANLAVACALAAGFLLLYHRPAAHRVLRRLAPVGQMALTTYVTQTLVGVFILYGYGLGFIGRIGMATALGLALIIFALQVVAATWWLRRARYGPLEWLWRSLTFMRPADWRVPSPAPGRVA